MWEELYGHTGYIKVRDNITPADVVNKKLSEAIELLNEEIEDILSFEKN